MHNYQPALDLLDESGIKLRNVIYKIVYCEDTTDELMQDLFLKLIGSKKFSTASNKLAYAWRTAVNLALDHKKKYIMRVRLLSGDEADILEDSAGKPIDAMVKSELLEKIIALLADIRPPGKEIFIMRYVEGKNYQEIADFFGIKNNHARSICSKVLGKLRIKLAAIA